MLYTDANGRDWFVRLTIGALERIRGYAGVDLLDAAATRETLERITDDPATAADLLYAACFDQACARGVDRDAFARAVAGEAADRAAAAAVRAIEAFFPEPKEVAPDDDGGDRTADQTRDLIWDMAGVAGVDPNPLSLRELARMGEARQKTAWAHTSSVMALIANCNRQDPKDRTFTPDDFNPYHVPARDDEPIEVGIEVLKVFVAGAQ